MSVWKIVSGVLSIVLCFFVIFQSCAAGIVNAIAQNGDISGSAGLIVAILLLVGGIVSIATRDALGNGGNISIIILYGIASLIGYMLAGTYTDLLIWATWCLLCAVVAAMAIAADNVCGVWVYIIIAVIGIAFALFGFVLNASGDGGDAKQSEDKQQTSIQGGPQREEQETFEVLPEAEENAPSDSENSGSSESSNNSDNVEMVGSGDLGDYHVEIKGAEIGKNYSDESIIIITYAWTNNSDETASAMYTVSEQAFQDGVELESSFSAKGVDFSNNSKEVRPGHTIDIKAAYVLSSDSTVEFEITEWISFSDDMVTMDFDPSSL